MKKKPSKKGVLAAAVLWSVTTAMWTVTTVLRFRWDYGNEGLQVLTVFTLLASAAACFANWYRYANDEE